MVKLPSAIAACLCMALAFASPRLLAAEGLLKDPGFEGGTRQVGDCTRVRGSLPLNWSDNSCWHTEAQVSYEPVPLPARSGRALKVSLSRGRFQLVQPIELPLDAQLRAGVWMRADPPMVVKVGLRQSGPPYQEHGVRTLRIQDAWTWVEATSATHGLWDQAGRQALFLVTSATPGNLWLDEASLKVSPSTLSLPPMEVPPAYFGTHVHHAVNLKSAQAESGAGAVRIWDSSQSQWFQVQKRRPRPGQKNHEWGALDERVSLASQKGQELLMVLGGYAPAWASMPEGANEASLPECHRCSENPTRLSDWQNWVADVAGRYKGRSIRAWETWNEPNFPPKHPWCPDEQACRSGLGSFYKGTPEQLLVLQNEAARIVRQVDPGAWVVSPGISHHHRNYLDYFLRIGGGREVDAIGYHFYLEGLPESLMPHALSIRLLMKDHGVGGKPLWNTEGGVPVASPESDPAGAGRSTARPALAEQGGAGCGLPGPVHGGRMGGGCGAVLPLRLGWSARVGQRTHPAQSQHQRHRGREARWPGLSPGAGLDERAQARAHGNRAGPGLVASHLARRAGAGVSHRVVPGSAFWLAGHGAGPGRCQPPMRHRRRLLIREAGRRGGGGSPAGVHRTLSVGP